VKDSKISKTDARTNTVRFHIGAEE